MNLVVIFLIALTSVCATPSIKNGERPNRNPVVDGGEYGERPIRNPIDGDKIKVPLVEISLNYQEILMEIEQKEEYEDNLNIPVDTPKEHLGLHYIETPDEMQEMGVNLMNINPDLIEDAFLLVVCITDVFLFLSIQLYVSSIARTYPKTRISIRTAYRTNI